MEDRIKDLIASKVVDFLAGEGRRYAARIVATSGQGSFGPALESEVAAVIEAAMDEEGVVFYSP